MADCALSLSPCKRSPNGDGTVRDRLLASDAANIHCRPIARIHGGPLSGSNISGYDQARQYALQTHIGRGT